jgi:hypothetical protein
VISPVVDVDSVGMRTRNLAEPLLREIT